MIDAEKRVYPISLLCEVFEVSRSGYYAWRKAVKSGRQKAYESLIPVVQEAHITSKGSYGSRRMAKEIREAGTPCGRTKAATIMKLAEVAVRPKKKFKVTTDSRHSLAVAPNRLEREFTVDEPDRVYVSDITYLWTREGWLYLAVVLDLFSRQVVGWSLNHSMERTLVMDALRMAVWRRNPAAGLIFHSDRGSQYCSHDFQKMLEVYGMLSSMSGKGDCWDNAVAESFFGSLKTERVFLTEYATREEARRDVMDYIEMYYNSRRRHSYLGYVSPREFEAMHQQKKSKVA